MKSPFAGLREVAPVVNTTIIGMPVTKEETALRLELFWRAMSSKGFAAVESTQRRTIIFDLAKGWSTDPTLKASEEARISKDATEAKKAFVKDTEGAQTFGASVHRDTIQIVVRYTLPGQGAINATA